MFDTDDTIVAIASPAGAALRGVVRVSGNRAIEFLSQLIANGPWRFSSRAIQFAGSMNISDSLRDFPARFFVWPTTASYTGQPVVECHLLSARPILEAVVDRFVSVGARPARPGEFTLRAFLAGRLDLVQAEAVLAVIDADNDRQLTSALRQLAGGMTTRLHRAREQLLNLLAEIEAGLDFVEEDIEFISEQKISEELAEVTRVVAETKSQFEQRRLTNERPRIVLQGLPNAGKSSLINAIAGAEIAIVSSQPGTTRDWLVAETKLDGIAVDWVDTAGVEHVKHGSIESDAQAATRQQSEQADLQILCIDLTSSTLTQWERDQLNEVNSTPHSRAKLLIVGTKADASHGTVPEGFPNDSIVTSSRSGAGIRQLQQAIRDRLQTNAHDEVETTQLVAATAQRCSASLRSAYESLITAKEIIGLGMNELLSAELRIALDAIGEVTGQVYTDDILDCIFSRFCIGK